MSKTMKAAIAGVAIALITAGTAVANHLNEETAYAALHDEYGYIYEANCGAKVGIYLDFESFKPHYKRPYDIDEVVNYCGEGVSAIGLLCRDNPNYSTAVRSSIEIYSCHWNEHALDGPSIALQNNQLFIGVNWKTPNVSTEIYHWIRDNL